MCPDFREIILYWDKTKMIKQDVECPYLEILMSLHCGASLGPSVKGYANLKVISWIPVYVIEDEPGCTNQIQSHTSCLGAQQKHSYTHTI